MAKNPFSGSIDVSSLVQILQEVTNGTKSVASAEEELQKAYKKTVAEVKKLEKVQKELNDTRSINTQLSELKNSLNQIKDALKKVGTNSSGTTKSFKSMDDALKSINVSLDGFKEKSSNITSAGNKVTQYTNGMNQLVTVTQKGSGATATYSAKVKTLNTQVQQSTKHIKNAAFATENWSYNWAKAMQSFLTYNTVTQFFNTIMNSIHDMIDQVKELDDALVELQKVTDLEGESLRKFTDDAYEAGREVAKTGTEMIEAATAFAKAGYKDEALELGTVAAMYTNIADEAIDASDAADMIISQMKAFNITAEDSIHIIDAINEVSNNYAVSSADIARNLGKASAVMANAGNSMEQYIGLMTAATEVTRNASKAANGLKTLTLRLQGMNDEGERDLEIQAQMEGLFNKLGISVYKVNGELKNTYEILETLAPVYKTLTNAEKAYVTETIAGKYQAQNAAAILMNWSTAVEATTTAMNSQGSAAKENEKVLASSQGRLQDLKSAWENLSRSLISSDLIKIIVDFGTTLLNIANNNTVQFIAKISALIFVLNILSKTSLVKTISTLFTLATTEGVAATSTLALSMAMDTLNKTAIGRLIIGLGSYIKALVLTASTQGVVAASTMALQGAFNLLAAHPVIASLAAFVGICAILNEHTKSLKREIEELNSDLEDLDSINSRLSEISTELDNENLTAEEQKNLFNEIKDIQVKLRKEYGLNTSELHNQTGELQDQVKALQDYVELKEREKNLELLNKTEELGSSMSFGEFILTPSRWFDGFTKEGNKRIEDDINTYYENIKKYAKGASKEIQEAFGQLEGALTEKGITQDKLNEYLTNVINAINNSDFSDEVKAALQIEASDTRQNIFETLLPTFRQQDAQKYINMYKKSIEFILREIVNKGLDKNYFKELLEKDILNDGGFPDFNKMIDNLTPEEFNFLSPLATAASKAGIPLKDFIEILAQLYPQIQTIDDMTEQTRTSFENLGKELETIQSHFNDVQDALEQYNENGYFTIDNLEKILKLSDKEINALMDENGNIRSNVDIYKELTNAKLDDMQASEDSRYYNELLRLAQLDEAGAAQLAAGSINAHDNAMAGQEVNAERLRAQIQKNIEKFNEESAAALQAAYDINEARHKQNTSAIEKTRLGVNKNISGTLGRKSSSSSSQTKEKEWWEKELEALKDQFDNNEITVNEYINSLTNLLGKIGQGTEAWKKINKELQKQKLDKIKDNYDAGRISLNQYIISLQNLQKEYKQSTKEWNSLADAIKKAKLDQLKEQQNDLKEALSAVNNTLEKQIDLQEELKDKAIDNIEKQIDAQEKLKENYEKDDDRYQRAQKAVVDFLNEQLDSINEQKDTVENYYDDVINAIEKMNEDTKESIELAEAYEALMNAMTQKTKKVYKEGLGWVWTTDAEAIKEAKKTYEDLITSATTKEIEEQKDKTVKSLEEQIESLQDYIDSWDKVFDKFDNEKNRNLADILLGENWSEMVSNLDPQIVDDFSDAYYELQKNLEETEKQIEELNKQKEEEDEQWDKLIKDLQDYKGEWADIANVYEETQNALKAKQIMGANWEKEILDRRLDVLENFKNKYNTILKEIDKVDNMSADQASGYTALRLPGYANGGEVDYTGLAVLHGTPNKPEYVLNNSQMRNLLGNLTKPRTTSIINNKSGAVVNNYNFGDIELPNVTNAQQFANELKSMLNITKNQ